VVYICAESHTYMQPRLRAWRKAHNLSETTEQFRIITCAVPMLDEKIVGYFIKAITQAGLKPKLIVIDTLARCFEKGDENSTQDMNAFVNGCERLRSEFPGASTLVVHHTGKTLEKGGRGSSALLGAVDIEFTAKKKEHDNDITLKNTKAGKNSAWLEPLYLELEDIDPDKPGHGYATLKRASAAAIKEARESECASKQPKVQAAFKALQVLGPNGASTAEWVKAAGFPESSLKNYRDTLVSQGRVERRGEKKATRWHVVEELDAEELLHEGLSPSPKSNGLDPQPGTYTRHPRERGQAAKLPPDANEPS
jgi:hypothetical protein